MRPTLSTPTSMLPAFVVGWVLIDPFGIPGRVREHNSQISHG